MAVVIKSEKEIRIMRDAGSILAWILREIVREAKAKVSTTDLDQLAFQLCKKKKVIPGFLGYQDYPATACFGVNDTIVHGLPSEDEILKQGDIVSIDMGIIYQGYYSDHAVTIEIGQVADNAKRLVSVTKSCLDLAIKQAKIGNTLGDIGSAIQLSAESAGFQVVKQMVGHGIGRALHEDPQIPGFGIPGQGSKLKKGTTIAIEAIINEGKEGIRFLDDGWTTKTIDGKLSALFEHCVVVREYGGEVLTK